MAERPVFRAIKTYPYVKTMMTEFKYYSGFSLAQKRRCIESLHGSYGQAHPGVRVLEISSRSADSLGVALSAFNLQIVRPERSCAVECAFQGSKVFEFGGPYEDLIDASPRSAKRDERLRTSGRVVGFRFDGVDYPTEPKDLFYNWIYVNALCGGQGLLEQVLEYDAFTDIEFNPAKSLNCQAKAAAIAVGLSRAGALDAALESVSSFKSIVYV